MVAVDAAHAFAPADDGPYLPRFFPVSVKPAADRGRTHLVVLGERPDAGPSPVPLRKVGGDYEPREESVVLSSGSEGSPSYAEGPGCRGHGPVGGEGLADLLFSELMAAVSLSATWWDPDSPETEFNGAGGHAGRFGQLDEGFAGLVAAAKLPVVHDPSMTGWGPVGDLEEDVRVAGSSRRHQQARSTPAKSRRISTTVTCSPSASSWARNRSTHSARSPSTPTRYGFPHRDGRLPTTPPGGSATLPSAGAGCAAPAVAPTDDRSTCLSRRSRCEPEWTELAVGRKGAPLPPTVFPALATRGSPGSGAISVVSAGRLG